MSSPPRYSPLPDNLKRYFWDIPFEELEVQKHAFLVIKRILDRGDLRDVQWIMNVYGNEAIREVLQKTKDLSRPTANFWADILGVDKKKVVCLQKPYSPIHFGLSS